MTLDDVSDFIRRFALLEIGCALLALALLWLLWSWTPFVLRSDLDDLQERVERLERLHQIDHELEQLRERYRWQFDLEERRSA